MADPVVDPNKTGAALLQEAGEKSIQRKVGNADAGTQFTLDTSLRLGKYGDGNHHKTWTEAQKRTPGTDAAFVVKAGLTDAEKNRTVHPRPVFILQFDDSAKELLQIKVEGYREVNGNRVVVKQTLHEAINDIIATECYDIIKTGFLDRNLADKLCSLFTFKITNLDANAVAKYRADPILMDDILNAIQADVKGILPRVIDPTAEKVDYFIEAAPLTRIRPPQVNLSNTNASGSNPPAGGNPPPNNPPGGNPQGGSSGGNQTNPTQGGSGSSNTSASGAQQNPGGASSTSSANSAQLNVAQLPTPVGPEWDLQQRITKEFPKPETHWHFGGTEIEFHFKPVDGGTNVGGKVSIKQYPKVSVNPALRDRSNPIFEVEFDIGNNNYTFEERMMYLNYIRSIFSEARSAKVQDHTSSFFRGVSGRYVSAALCHLDMHNQFGRKPVEDDNVLKMLDKTATTMTKRLNNSQDVKEYKMVAMRELVVVDEHPWSQHGKEGDNPTDRYFIDPNNDPSDPTTPNRLEFANGHADKMTIDPSRVLDNPKALDAWRARFHGDVPTEANEIVLQQHYDRLVERTHRALFGQYEYRVKLFERDTGSADEFKLCKHKWNELLYFHDDDGNHLYLMGDLMVPYKQRPEDSDSAGYRRDVMNDKSVDKDITRSMFFGIWDMRDSQEKVYKELEYFTKRLALDTRLVQEHKDMTTKSKLLNRALIAFQKQRRDEDDHPYKSKAAVGIFRLDCEGVNWQHVEIAHIRQCRFRNFRLKLYADKMTWSDNDMDFGRIWLHSSDGKASTQSLSILRGRYGKHLEIYGGVASGVLLADRWSPNMLGIEEFKITLGYQTLWEIGWRMRGAKIRTDLIHDSRWYDCTISWHDVPFFGATAGSFFFRWNKTGMASHKDNMHDMTAHDAGQINVEQFEVESKSGTSRTGSVRHSKWRICASGNDNETRVEIFGYTDTPDDWELSNRKRKKLADIWYDSQRNGSSGLARLANFSKLLASDMPSEMVGRARSFAHRSNEMWNVYAHSIPDPIRNTFRLPEAVAWWSTERAKRGLWAILNPHKSMDEAPPIKPMRQHLEKEYLLGDIKPGFAQVTDYQGNQPDANKHPHIELDGNVLAGTLMARINPHVGTRHKSIPYDADRFIHDDVLDPVLNRPTYDDMERLPRLSDTARQRIKDEIEDAEASGKSYAQST